MSMGFRGAFLVAGLLGCSSSTGMDTAQAKAASTATPVALTAAHQAYLDGDFLALGEHVRDVILDRSASELAKENAYELVEKAYEVNKGKLPSRFKPPAGYDAWNYAYYRVATPDGTNYMAQFRLFARDASHVKVLTLRHSPSGATLDKATSSVVRHDPAGGGLDELIVNSGPLESPPGDGIVTMHIELDDGTTSDGFVIVHGLAAATTPDVRSPAEGATVNEQNPLVTWEPQARGVAIHVYREEDGALVWEFGTREPGFGQVRLGSDKGVPAGKLAPGNYIFDVTAADSERAFGPVTLMRASRTYRRLHVAR